MGINLLLHHNSNLEASLSNDHRSPKEMEVPNECPILALNGELGQRRKIIGIGKVTTNNLVQVLTHL